MVWGWREKPRRGKRSRAKRGVGRDAEILSRMADVPERSVVWMSG